MSIPEELDKAIRRIKTIEEKRPSHKEMLEFLKCIMTEQYRIKPRIKVEPVNISEEMAKLKLREGSALIDKKDLKLDVGSATDLFKRLCKVVQKKNEKANDDIERISEELYTGRLNLGELFESVVAGDEEYLHTTTEKLGLNEDLLLFLARNSISPILEAYASQLGEYVDQRSWWRGYCPICGSEPIIGELRKGEGERYLLCSSCGFQWRFKRMMCPFCGNEDRKKHRYFYMENETRGYRVDVCEECRRYVKTIDSRELKEEVVLPIEDIGTLHLDILAQKEGYERVTSNG